MRPSIRREIPPALYLVVLFIFTATQIFAADKLTASQLIDLSKSKGSGLRDAIAASFTDKELKEGTAWLGHGPDFFFATEATAKPELFIDGAPGPQMQKMDSNLWYGSA